MTPDRLALVKRIQKLLALGTRNSNPAEASAALAKAQALMAEHKVSAIELATITQAHSRAQASLRPPMWQCHLAEQIVQGFGVERVLDRAPDGRTVWCFIGADYRVAIAVYAYDVLGRQCRTATRAFMAKVRVRKQGRRGKVAEEYALGFVISACKLLAKIAPPAEDERAALAQYMAGLQLTKAKPKATSTQLGKAALHGMMDGKQADLHHGTPGEAKPVLPTQTLALRCAS